MGTFLWCNLCPWCPGLGPDRLVGRASERPAGLSLSSSGGQGCLHWSSGPVGLLPLQGDGAGYFLADGESSLAPFWGVPSGSRSDSLGVEAGSCGPGQGAPCWVLGRFYLRQQPPGHPVWTPETSFLMPVLATFELLSQVTCLVVRDGRWGRRRRKRTVI